MFVKSLTVVALFAVSAHVLACSSSVDEEVQESEQHVDRATPQTTGELICLRQDPKNPGHPSIDDYTPNKADRSWLETWTTPLETLMATNAEDCSKSAVAETTCIDSSGKYQRIVLHRFRAFELKEAQLTRELVQPISVAGSCTLNRCGDPTDETSSGQATGFAAKEPQKEKKCKDFSGSSVSKSTTVKLNFPAEEELVVQVPSSQNAVTIKVGSTTGTAQMAYDCKSTLEQEVGACDAISLQAEKTCNLFSKRGPLWMSCRTEAIAAGRRIKSLDADTKEVGTAATWEVQDVEAKVKVLAKGCRPPGESALGPSGVPYHSDLRGECLGLLAKRGAE